MRRTSPIPHKWSTVFLVVSVFIGTFLFILPSLMKDRVFSSYYSYDKADPGIAERALQKNSQRMRLAKRYLNRIIAETEEVEANRVAKPDVAHQHHFKDITVGIISLQRSVEKERMVHLGYLSQVVAVYHRLAKHDTHFGKKNIFVCNVDAGGHLYDEATNLKSVVDVVVKNLEKPKSIQAWDKFEREKTDYQFCLNKTLDYKTSLVLLVEDDAIPQENFFPILHQKLNYLGLISSDVETQEDALSRQGFVKLYYPEKWAGYGNELQHISELVCIAIAGGIAFHIVCSLCLLLVNKGKFTKMTRPAAALVVVCGSLYSVMVAWTMGRPYIIEYFGDSLNWYWLIVAKDCCTQSTLYSSSTAKKLVNYLAVTECDIDFSVDAAIDQFVKQHQLRATLIEPNLVKHIGMFSTLRTYSKNVGEFI